MIEKRRPHFEDMRHARAIDLRQDVVRQKIFLIEPQSMPAESSPRLQAQFCEHARPSAAGSVLTGLSSERFSRSEKVPLQYT